MKGLNQKGPRMAEKREVNGNITPRKKFSYISFTRLIKVKKENEIKVAYVDASGVTNVYRSQCNI